MIDHSPLRLVAIRLFTESFGDLFSVRGKITLFEKSLIEGAYEILWLDGLDETPNASWKQTVRAAFRIIDNGALNEPQLVWESYISIVNDIVPLLQKCFERRRFFKQKATDDDLIEGLLSSYKSIYEGLLPTILAPSIYAFGLINDPNEKSFKPKHDGRISFSALKKMERWVRPPHNRLAIGLNNHVRNAYSHERYRILDGERTV